MRNKRKIAVVTGSRAEYGLLYWLMHEIKEDSELELQVIVTGMHLSPEFGMTYRQIEADGFYINVKVESQLSSDTAVGVSKSVGLGVIGFADAFYNLKPDIVVLLGDRFEILAAAQAALFAKIPIAHLYGGEVTEGNFDESIRHAITKMSQLHFVGAEPYRKRVIQLGERAERVFNVGVTGIDHLTRTHLLSRIELEKQLDFKLSERCFLVTYHPVTLIEQSVSESLNELFNALDCFQEYKIIFTKSNADPGGRLVGSLIDSYVDKNKKRSISFISLGTLKYLSTLKYIDLVIGNSSSGIIEVPYFHKPTVNIGERQKGRIRIQSIIDCKEKKEDIVNGINKAISIKDELKITKYPLPFGRGDGTIARRIKEKLKSVDLGSGILNKSFYDIQFVE